MSTEIKVALDKLDESKADFENLLEALQHGTANLKEFIPHECGRVYYGMEYAFNYMVSMSNKMETIIKSTIGFVENTRDKMAREDSNAAKQFK